MFGYCYITTSALSDHIYIGQRMGDFVPSYHGSGTIIKRAMAKYGRNNFNTEIYDFADSQESLNQLEIDAISILRSYGCKLYNLDGGGKNSIKTAETRKKIGDANRGRRMSEESKMHLSRISKGAVQSQARIDAIKKAQLSRVGIKTSLKTIEKIKESLAKTTRNKGLNCWRFGKKVSPEEIAKRTATRKMNRLKMLSNV